MSTDNGKRSEHPGDRVPLPAGGRIYIRVVVREKATRFYYSSDGTDQTAVGPTFDASTLSDEYCVNGKMAGSFVGITAQVFDSKQSVADFDYFKYQDL